MDDLDKLRAVAQVATPGPWEQEPNTMAGRVWVRTAWNSDLEPNTLRKFFQWRRLFAVRTYRESHAKTPEQVYRQREADARHIATFDPPTVLALLDRIERAEIYGRIATLHDRFLPNPAPSHTVAASVQTAVESIVAARVAYYDELIASANRIITAHTERAERAETERDLLQTEVNTWIENDQISFARATRLDDEITDLRAAVTNLADELETNNCVCGGCGACDNEIHLVPRLRSLLAAAPTETEATPDE